MKKVLYIISTLEKTGPVNVLYNIIKNINRLEFEPVILTLSKEKDKSRKQDFENLNIKIFSLNLQGLKGYYESKQIKKIVETINPDIIHTHCFRSTLFAAVHLRKRRTITTIHCDYDSDYKMTYGKTVGYIMSKLTDFSLKTINKRIACSGYLSQIINGKKKFNVEFVNNGIDIEKYYPIENKEQLRNKLKLPIDKSIFIWVGCLTEIKNPVFLAKIIKENSFKNCFFIFCGDGSLKQELENIVSTFNNVLITGNIDNVQEYLQASDFYISTSLSEGLPLSVLEAMACGLPCILSNIEQHEYILQEQTGMLFKSQNSVDLINKLNDIVKVDYNLYSSCARQVVLENFSSELMSANYRKKYEELSK